MGWGGGGAGVGLGEKEEGEEGMLHGVLYGQGLGGGQGWRDAQ